MKFYDVDLPDLIQFIDCDIYDKVKEYILLISRTELLTCAACQSAFSIVQEQADMATKQYTMECFFNDNPVLSQPLLYEFEPCDNDKINKLSTEHNAGLCLSKEARRWATCVAKETRVIRDSTEELKKLNAQLGDKPPFTIIEQGPQAEVEQRIDELRQVIRRAQTSKKKAEARLEAMRESGVNVDEWVRTFDIEPVSTSEPPADVLSRSGTVTSRASQKSYQSENYDAGTEANDVYYDSDSGTEPPSSAPVNGMTEPTFTTELASAEDVVAAVQSAWDAAAAEPEEVEEPEPVPEPEPQKLEPTPAASVNGEVSPALSYTRCVAMFSYQATNTDELSFVEQEELDLIGEGDGDGWITARNYRGEEGYIPQNYVEVLDGQSASTSPRPPLTSFSSVDYSMPEGGEEVAPSEVPASNEAVVKSAKEEATEPAMVNGEVPAEEIQSQEYYFYCRAVYDYEATCDEELTFFEGQIIRIIRKSVTDVDDGWWEGEVDGKIGLFPSLVVEELKENGEPMTPVDVVSPTSSLPPPAFTPPKPQMLILPAQVILTQPTPEIENPYDPPSQKTPEDETKYAPLVSSPDSPTKSMAASLKESTLEKISEEKTEPVSSAKSDSECPTLLVTETKFAEFDDEFIYQENGIEGEIVKDAEKAYESTNTFECTFPDAQESAAEETKPSAEVPSEVAPSEKPKEVTPKAPARPAPIVPEQNPQMEPDSDVKMEVGSDIAEDNKVHSDFFEVTG